MTVGEAMDKSKPDYDIFYLTSVVFKGSRVNKKTEMHPIYDTGADIHVSNRRELFTSSEPQTILVL